VARATVVLYGIRKENAHAALLVVAVRCTAEMLVVCDFHATQIATERSTVRTFHSVATFRFEER